VPVRSSFGTFFEHAYLSSSRALSLRSGFTGRKRNNFGIEMSFLVTLAGVLAQNPDCDCAIITPQALSLIRQIGRPLLAMRFCNPRLVQVAGARGGRAWSADHMGTGRSSGLRLHKIVSFLDPT